MNKDSKESIEYLDEKFTGIDEKFFKITNVLIDIKSRVDELHEQKADKSDINNLLNAIDSYAKRAETFFQEMVVLSHKVDRHEKWFHQIAEKVGVKLEY